MISCRFTFAVSAVVLAVTAFALLAASDKRVKPANTDEGQKQFDEMKAAFNKLSDDHKELADRFANLKGEFKELKRENGKLIDESNKNLKEKIRQVKGNLASLHERTGVIEKLPRVMSGRIKLDKVRRGESTYILDVSQQKTLGVCAWVAEIPFGLAKASIISVAFDPEKKQCRVIYNSNWNQVTENWLNYIVVYEP